MAPELCALFGLASAEIGDRRGVATRMLRSQLRSIFAEAGTTRQSGLMT